MSEDNKNLEMTELKDNDLETVNGGTGLKEIGKYECPYCHCPHKMYRCLPLKVRYNNEIIKNAERYECKHSGYQFYIIPDYYGQKIYLDSNFQPIQL